MILCVLYESFREFQAENFRDFRAKTFVIFGPKTFLIFSMKTFVTFGQKLSWFSVRKFSWISGRKFSWFSVRKFRNFQAKTFVIFGPKSFIISVQNFCAIVCSTGIRVPKTDSPLILYKNRTRWRRGFRLYIPYQGNPYCSQRTSRNIWKIAQPFPCVFLLQFCFVSSPDL